jgi:hypothetical protein
MAGDGGCNKDESGDHRLWFEKPQAVLLLIAVLASSLSLPYFRALNDRLPDLHPARASLLAGLVVGLLTFPVMWYADNKFAESNSTLLGLLVAEFVVYGAPCEFPPPVVISFFLFMFYMGREEAEHLWPDHEYVK